MIKNCYLILQEVREKIEKDFKIEECAFEFYIHEVVLKFIAKNKKTNN